MSERQDREVIKAWITKWALTNGILMTGRGAAALLPDGRIVRLEPSEVGLTWKVRAEPQASESRDARCIRSLEAKLEAEQAAHRETAQALERTRRERDARAGMTALYDKLGEAIEEHLPEHADGELLARIANAGAVLDATARDRDEWRRKHDDLGWHVEQFLPKGERADGAEPCWKFRIGNAGYVLEQQETQIAAALKAGEAADEACAELETALAIKRTDPDEPLDERLWRVYTLVHLQRSFLVRAERSRDLWKAKAKRAEAGRDAATRSRLMADAPMRRGKVVGLEARRAARMVDAARSGHRTGKQRAKGERKGKR